MRELEGGQYFAGEATLARPHPVVTDVGAFFFAHRRGLFAYTCRQVNP